MLQYITTEKTVAQTTIARIVEENLFQLDWESTENATVVGVSAAGAISYCFSHLDDGHFQARLALGGNIAPALSGGMHIRNILERASAYTGGRELPMLREIDYRRCRGLVHREQEAEFIAALLSVGIEVERL